MTALPISNPAPAHRETLYSYLSRVAGVWRTDVAGLASDMGAGFKPLLDNEEAAFKAVADWTDLSPEIMDELLSWTGTRAGNVRMQFRGELYVSRALRNPIMRGCPVCLREDADGATGSAHSAMVMRGDWQLREAALCVRHRHPLVPLWQAAAPRDRFDIGARLREIEAEILSGAFERPLRDPSAYDLWLDRRLEDGTDDTWLKEHPVFVVTTLCRLLGQAMLKVSSPGEEYASGRAHAAGFDIVVDGAVEIRAALDRIATDATGALDEPGRAFGPLYTKLNRDYLDEPGFDPFRSILRGCILDNWPIAAGEVVLGEVVPQRRLHSLRTASLEAGIGVRALEPFLIEAGALREGDPRPDSRRLFDAQAQAGLLAEIPTLVGPIAMRNAMGATRMELEALAEAGVLKPRTRVRKVKNPWRLSDGVALVAELSDGAIAVEDEDKDWETLLLAYRRSGVALDDLIRNIRNERLTVGKRARVPGFHGIVVPKSEVDVLAAPRQVTRDEALEEVPGSMAAADFGRSVGLRDGGVFQAMIEAGHVSAYQIINPRTSRPQHRMSPEDMAAFHRRFVTLTTLAAETGQHRNTLKGAFAARRITPFSPEGRDFGAVYLRVDVVGLLR
ncbi:TniQ family protein [Rhodobacteraceae bacterium 2376]|uniref:TniQ family protein n=1 Tax=Rhabdonatronobacter sediminivivens TaxID=2743469 RepID=A0A7Z0I2S3_9RHOB|nr:TniQ family protein [Rhabdonatronobacter sediminivivens]NYS26866.1 TniQ family protein [Rhabdonatronobacter sediminivivens]